jgi:hypothetical protein
MLFKDTIAAQPSGSLGGIVFSHNRGGSYTRIRSIPTNPNTPFQQTVRSAMAALSAMWSGVLTQTQRDSWDSYALATPLINRVGDPINVGGLGMFQRTNVLVLQTAAAGGVVLLTAPTIFNLGEFSEPSVQAISEATQQMVLNFNTADPWVGETDSNMLVFISRPQNPSIQYFKGPYRFAGSIDGDATTPPTSPATINVTFPVLEDQKIFYRVRVIRSDGRVSAEFFDNHDVGA